MPWMATAEAGTTSDKVGLYESLPATYAAACHDVATPAGTASKKWVPFSDVMVARSLT